MALKNKIVFLLSFQKEARDNKIPCWTIYHNIQQKDCEISSIVQQSCHQGRAFSLPTKKKKYANTGMMTATMATVEQNDH